MSVGVASHDIGRLKRARSVLAVYALYRIFKRGDTAMVMPYACTVQVDDDDGFFFIHLILVFWLVHARSRCNLVLCICALDRRSTSKAQRTDNTKFRLNKEIFSVCLKKNCGNYNPFCCNLKIKLFFGYIKKCARR